VLDGTGHGYNGTLATGATWQSASDEPVAPTFSLPLTNLQAGTLYSCRIVVTNSSSTNFGNTVTFTTPPLPPVAITQTGTAISSFSAVLTGAVNPSGGATLAYFQYGTDTNYGLFSATNLLAATNINVSVTNLISGLQPATTYHFQIVAGNSAGTATGGDLTFTVPAAARTLTPINITATNAMLTAAVITNVMPANAWFKWGLGTNLDQVTSMTNLAPSPRPRPWRCDSTARPAWLTCRPTPFP
jgi:hypothetical protein